MRKLEKIEKPEKLGKYIETDCLCGTHIKIEDRPDLIGYTCDKCGQEYKVIEA